MGNARVELPLLDAATEIEINRENLLVAALLYYSYQLEEMRMFHVIDRIVELFAQGQLPIGRAGAAETLIASWRERRPNPESARRNAYWRMFGMDVAARSAAPAPPGEPNREFSALWLRFVAAVASLVRQTEAPALLIPPTEANAAVRKAARELAVNLSTHGWGAANLVAQRLAADTQQATEILGDREVQAAFGARGTWQVIDRVSTEHLGGARDLAHRRTLANAGRRIIEWLATLDQPSSQDDWDLVNAVEQWITASAAADAKPDEDGVEQFSQPREPPAVPRPAVALPLIARDVLDALGLAATEGGNAARGLIAHFHGAPRSGKTLAAHMVGAALSKDVFRIDLGEVVDTAVGETANNIDAIFDAAERAAGVLLLDEADALFGKRPEVGDAHDRYANIDVEHLLQRIERYDGLVILTSNLRENIDLPFAGGDTRRRCRAVRFPR